MQRILKFVEKSSLVEEFKVHDFKTGEGFAYIKLRFALKSTHPVGRSMPPPLSRGDLDQKRIIGVSGLFSVDGERRTENGERLFTLF